MKLIFLLVFIISSYSFADEIDKKQELARFEVNCNGISESNQEKLDANMNGTISVFSKYQTGQLKLGSIGVFEFVADFKFHLNQKNNGKVTFSFRKGDGLILSKNSLVLPKNATVETSVYYFDTASQNSASVQCSVKPTSAY